MDETVGMVMEKVEGIKGTVGEIKEKVFSFKTKHNSKATFNLSRNKG